MPRNQIAAVVSLCFSLYWAVMTFIQWQATAGTDAPPPLMRAFLCAMFAVLAITLWRGRPR